LRKTICREWSPVNFDWTLRAPAIECRMCSLKEELALPAFEMN